MRRSSRLAAAGEPGVPGSAAADAAAAGEGGAASVTLSVEDAVLGYQAELRRRLGLHRPGGAGRVNQLLLLLLQRTGGRGGSPLLPPSTMSREVFMRNVGARRLPNEAVGSLDQFGASLFSGTFDRCGARVAVAAQDGCISIFDTDQLLYSTASQQHEEGTASASSRRFAPHGRVQPRKQLHCRDVGWALIGTSFSPDGRWIAYSSWSRFLHLANVTGEHELHEPILVSRSSSRHFCLFSLAFSSDGARVVGGGNDGGIHVVHLEQKRADVVADAHFDDVNAVCFLHDDQDSMILSGSDDGLVKLFDLRAPPDRACGLLVGHAHGITSVASSGDGRRILSNSKDQTIKMWDLRLMADSSPETTERFAITAEWDYRWAEPAADAALFRSIRRRRRDADLSLATFAGHRVARTLIQATFSSAITGGRYIISGSADGSIFIWDTQQAATPEPDAGAFARAGAAGTTAPAAPAPAPAGATNTGPPAVVRPMRKLEHLHRDCCVRTVACSPHHDLIVSAGFDRSLGLLRYVGSNGQA